jgi:membrane protein DedA with SNARE-associated domain
MTSALDVLVRYGYLVVSGAVFAEPIGLPFPSEPILLAPRRLAGNGHLNLLIAPALGATASLIGDTAWYWIGRLRGPRVLGWLCRLSLERSSSPSSSRASAGSPPAGRRGPDADGQLPDL